MQATEGPCHDLVSEDSQAENHVILYSGVVNEVTRTYHCEASANLETVLIVLPQRLRTLGGSQEHDLEALEHLLEEEERIGEEGAVDYSIEGEDHS